MFILNAAATITNAGAQTLRQAPGWMSSHAPQFFTNAYQTASPLQLLQGGNGALGFLGHAGSFFSNLLSDPMAMIGIGLPIAAFFFSWLVPIAAAFCAIQVAQAIVKTPEVLSQSESMTDLNVIMHFACIGLGAFCILPGLGGLGQALARARVGSFTNAAGGAGKELQAASKVLSEAEITSDVVGKTLGNVTKGVTRLEGSVASLDNSILGIAKEYGVVGEKVTAGLLRDTKIAIQKVMANTSDDAARALAEKATQRLAELTRLESVKADALRYLEQLKKAQEGLTRIQGKLQAGTPLGGDVAVFNNECNLVLPNAENCFQSFLTEVYGQNGVDFYAKFKALFGKNSSQAASTAAHVPTHVPATTASLPGQLCPAGGWFG